MRALRSEEEEEEEEAAEEAEEEQQDMAAGGGTRPGEKEPCAEARGGKEALGVELQQAAEQEVVCAGAA